MRNFFRHIDRRRACKKQTPPVELQMHAPILLRRYEKSTYDIPIVEFSGRKPAGVYGNFPSYDQSAEAEKQSMISHLHGRLAEKDLTRVVVDVQGIGFEVFIPMSTYDRLPHEGETTSLKTHMYIRDAIMQLYGFASEVERSLFIMLITSVSGIGPKIALNMLSAMPATVLCETVLHGDVKALTRINGIGKRTAERLVVELKDKIGDIVPEIIAGGKLPAGDGIVLQAVEDAVAGLVTLGFKPETARKAVNAVVAETPEADRSPDVLVRAALGSLNR